MNLNYEELQILSQCIRALNFPGKDVIRVGFLANKIQTEIIKMEESVNKEPIIKENKEKK